MFKVRASVSAVFVCSDCAHCVYGVRMWTWTMIANRARNAKQSDSRHTITICGRAENETKRLAELCSRVRHHRRLRWPMFDQTLGTRSTEKCICILYSVVNIH